MPVHSSGKQLATYVAGYWCKWPAGPEEGDQNEESAEYSATTYLAELPHLHPNSPSRNNPLRH